jgi:hypothetical protein
MQLNGTRQTKRRYNPPTSPRSYLAEVGPGPEEVASAVTPDEGGVTNADSDRATEAWGHPTWTAEGVWGTDADSDEANDVWGNLPSVTATPTDPHPAVGIPETWLDLDTRCPTAPPDAPAPPPPPTGINKWWLQLDDQCPTSLAEEANEQRARKPGAESLRAREKRRRSGGVEGEGAGRSSWAFDLRAIARRMEELATYKRSDRIYVPKLSQKRRNVVGSPSRITCFLDFDLF